MKRQPSAQPNVIIVELLELLVLIKTSEVILVG